MSRQLRFAIMLETRAQRNAVMRRLCALALALWLGGVGCLLGCEMQASAAPFVEAHEFASSASSDSCPMNAAHDCCHRSHEEGMTIAFGATSESSQTMNCCPLAGQSANIARKARFDIAPLALAENELLPQLTFNNATSMPFVRLRVPDRGSTYLRHCVFLI